MKIAIEASALQRNDKTGVFFYIQNISQSVISQMPNSQFSIYYFERGSNRKIELEGKNVRFYSIKNFSYRLYNLFFRYLTPINFDTVAKLNADVVLFPNFVTWPLKKKLKSVVIIYDTAFYDKPGYVPSRLRSYLNRFVPKAVKNSTHIVTISESTKKALIKNFNAPKEKISVINPALEPSYFIKPGTQSIEKTKKKYGISKDYLLYLGTIEPRKNVSGIIRAYIALPQQLKDKYQLVLAGGKGWLDEEIEGILKSVPSRQIVKTGYIDQLDKRSLYSGAKLFLYPSFYEGWGMQVLEAMACGTPVITANNSSLLEAGGDAAVYVTAGQDNELTQAIEQLLYDTKEYQARVKAGLAHAKEYTWEKSGKQLKEVFENI